MLVVIGETKDRGSQAKLDEAITQAQAANVTVYPVTYSVYSTSFTSRGDERFAGTDKRVYQPSAGLEKVIAKVGEDLHSQYFLSFLGDRSAAKSYHEIQVRVGRGGANVRARPGYWLE